MRSLSYILILFVFTHGIVASDFVELAGETRIPLPDKWQLLSDNDDYPFQLINNEQTAELLIYKSIIDQNNTIANKDDLKKSVDLVIADVIETLPGGKLQTSVGYFEDNRVSFTIEFKSIDTVLDAEVYNRLKGILYTHPDGHQLLFTLWGKTNKEAKSALHEEILFLQNQFSYFGKSEQHIFASSNNKIYFIIACMLGAILIFFRKLKMREKTTFPVNPHFWHCDCGRQNHIDNKSCRRCGRENSIEISV